MNPISEGFKVVYFLAMGIGVGFLFNLLIARWRPDIHQWIDRNLWKIGLVVFVVWLLGKLLNTYLASR